MNGVIDGFSLDESDAMFLTIALLVVERWPKGAFLACDFATLLPPMFANHSALTSRTSIDHWLRLGVQPEYQAQKRIHVLHFTFEHAMLSLIFDESGALTDVLPPEYWKL